MTCVVRIVCIAPQKCEENMRIVIKTFHCTLKAINMLYVGVFIMCCKQTEASWQDVVPIIISINKHLSWDGEKNIAYLDFPLILGSVRKKEVRKWQASYLICSKSFVYNDFIFVI